MRTNLVASLAVGIVLLAAFVPVSGAQSAEGTVTATASEDCQDTVYCWEVETEGDLSPGSTLTFVVKNPASNSATHDLFVQEGSPEQEGGDTNGSEADGSTGELQPGDEETFTLTISEGTEELYYWCDQGGHEALGMWGTLEATAGEDAGSDTGTDSEDTGSDTGDDSAGDEPQSESPGLGAAAALAVMALAAVLISRRS